MDTDQHATNGQAAPLSNRQRRQAEALALLTLLGETFPQAFIREWGKAPKPLAIGIHHDIAALMPEASPQTISAALRLYLARCRPLYWRAMVAGQPRFDLEGQPRGTVSAEEAEKARRDLAAWREKRKAKEQEQATQQQVVQATATQPQAKSSQKMNPVTPSDKGKAQDLAAKKMGGGAKKAAVSGVIVQKKQKRPTRSSPAWQTS